MRVAIVSDVHANLRAFEAVLADLRRVAPDVVVHGGDLVYGGTHPAEIIDQIRALEWPGVRGNTDEMLWSHQSLASFAAKTPQLGPLLERIEDLIPPTVASIGEERLRWLEGTWWRESRWFTPAPATCGVPPCPTRVTRNYGALMRGSAPRSWSTVIFTARTHGGLAR